jgi:hypothetical protein
MIIVYVGQEPNNGKIVEIDESTLKLMPVDLITHFSNLLTISDKPISVRVYTPTLIDWLGECVDEGIYSRHDITIHAVGCTFTYDHRGCILGSWPYGLFNYM